MVSEKENRPVVLLLWADTRVWIQICQIICWGLKCSLSNIVTGGATTGQKFGKIKCWVGIFRKFVNIIEWGGDFKNYRLVDKPPPHRIAGKDVLKALIIEKPISKNTDRWISLPLPRIERICRCIEGDPTDSYRNAGQTATVVLYEKMVPSSMLLNPFLKTMR